METARNGMLAAPMKGWSPTCWILSTSASGTRPSRTARRCSAPLKPSWPRAFTVMLTVPPVCILTASAKAMALWVWKLPSGHTVDKSQLAVAAVARVERWPAASIVAAPTVKVRRVIIRPLLLLKSKRMPPLEASARETVNRNRILVRHQAAFDVVANAFRRALPWLADPGTARRHHHKPIVRRHGLKALAAQLL